MLKSDTACFYSITPIVHERLELFYNDFLLPNSSLSYFEKVIVIPVSFTPDQSTTSLFESTGRTIVLAQTPSASVARNLGLDWLFSNLPRSVWSHSYVWFADDDCPHPLSDDFKSFLHLTPQPNVVLHPLYDFTLCKRVGKSLSRNSMLSKYAALFYGAPSIIVNLQSAVYFDPQLGPGTDSYSAEDTDFLLKSLYRPDSRFFLSNSYLPHPYSSLSTKKIYNYGIGQGLVLKQIFLSHYKSIPVLLPAIAFSLFILRPLIGLFISLILFRRNRIFLYSRRLSGIITGFLSR